MILPNTGYFDRLGLSSIREKVLSGQRLSLAEGMQLYQCPEPLAIGALAHERKRALHGDKAFFVVNRHVNYTNICINGCLFCAFKKDRNDEGAYVLSPDEVVEKLKATPISPREVHIVGGCHPDLPFSYYEDILTSVRANFPDTIIKAFTAEEIGHFAQLLGSPTLDVLNRLKKHGLSMLPGGGAEIFAPSVRQRICPNKCTGDEWLRVHKEAHSLGIKTNATMLFGHVETREDRLDHLDRLRVAQDEHGGFTCFIPLPFLTDNNELSSVRPLTGLEKLRTIAIARLMLDNIPHIKAYWVMLGIKTAQAALKFGADDFDGTVVEEKIGHDAGADSAQALSKQELADMLKACNCTPVERDALFRPVDGSEVAQ